MFTLPDLPYAYDALKPHIDALTMEIHHTKHHQAYIDKLNTALEKYPDWQQKSIEDILQNLSSVPEEIRTAVRNNGGGYANHNLFWTIMSPDGGGEPAGELAQAINTTFSAFTELKQQLSAAAAGQFGSGWGWLAVDGDDQLKILATPNQDSTLSQGFKPILGVDVWEHAYYLKYQNKRPDYIEAWWNVVNWRKVESLYLQALRA